VKIGDPIWFFDANRRTRPAVDAAGNRIGGPIWREQWVERQIIGETRVSWLVGLPGCRSDAVRARLPKKAFVDGACPSGWATAQEQIERLEWVEVHRMRICDAVRACGDYEALRRAAAAVGYNPAS